MRTEIKIIILQSVLRRINLKINSKKTTNPDIFLCNEIARKTRSMFPQVIFGDTETLLREHFKHLFDHKPSELLRHDQSWWSNNKKSLHVRKGVILKLIEKYESILVQEQSEQQKPD